jgi:hypothetical protein
MREKKLQSSCAFLILRVVAASVSRGQYKDIVGLDVFGRSVSTHLLNFSDFVCHGPDAAIVYFYQLFQEWYM